MSVLSRLQAIVLRTAALGVICTGVDWFFFSGAADTVSIVRRLAFLVTFNIVYELCAAYRRPSDQ
ncbi:MULTISPECIES: hypothetical protein [unclassified Janthinobacterium]|uniref:hypothetical protein n=1 Tax=unclassified Janthinobacterium TaxID=2610881 RepID=UPI00160D24D6|nr:MULTISPECIES: hypothetical protein [unclassified Janthinobacterium]MBB5609212.1 hypothetical protein [Janthinobacterium sp. S3T4]MBB5614385.1 hypothetical protein [Janthinobacterium sp. S3M3]